MIEVRQNEPLAERTWWRIGGVADHFVEPQNLEQVGEALLWADERNLSVTVLSGGSNVLISDAGIAGLTISLRQLVGLSESRDSSQLHIHALAGTPKAELTKIFLREKLAPAVFLCGIPGDVGGGVIMNAGVSETIVPREFTEIVRSVEVMTLVRGRPELKEFAHGDLKWSYRHVEGLGGGIVVRVHIAWPISPQAEVPSLVKQATRQRLLKQPLDLPSCGSVFRNPPGQRAGALIEQAGLKGFRMGGAEVSKKHANFIVNLGGAKAQDVAGIIAHVQAEVRARFQVELHCEVKYLGRW